MQDGSAVFFQLLLKNLRKWKWFIINLYLLRFWGSHIDFSKLLHISLFSDFVVLILFCIMYYNSIDLLFRIAFGVAWQSSLCSHTKQVFNLTNLNFKVSNGCCLTLARSSLLLQNGLSLNAQSLSWIELCLLQVEQWHCHAPNPRVVVEVSFYKLFNFVEL